MTVDSAGGAPVSILENSPASSDPAHSNLSQMARRRVQLVPVRLVARLHVDLQRLSSAICRP
ncbi:MAG: hypothetical protein JWQ60_3829 [Pseudonocardia sp.]|nr:hypothetical protein [Pseudonocardia sp.]